MEVAPVSADGSDVKHYTGRLIHHRQFERAGKSEETRVHVTLEVKIKGWVLIIFKKKKKKIYIKTLTRFSS